MQEGKGQVELSIFDNHLNPNAEQVDPQARCFLSGVPRAMYQPNQIQILRPDGLHVVERFTLVDPDRINYEVTIEDSTMYTRPWKMVVPIVRIKAQPFELMEYACHEGERDVQHIQRR